MANIVNPLQFIQQVRAEVSKVVWPARREVLLTTGMVFVMATLTAIFFFFVDLIIRTGLQGVLGMFGQGFSRPTIADITWPMGLRLNEIGHESAAGQTQHISRACMVAGHRRRAIQAFEFIPETRTNTC